MGFNVTAFDAFRIDDFEGKPDDEIKETDVKSVADIFGGEGNSGHTRG